MWVTISLHPEDVTEHSQTWDKNSIRLAAAIVCRRTHSRALHPGSPKPIYTGCLQAPSSPHACQGSLGTGEPRSRLFPPPLPPALVAGSPAERSRTHMSSLHPNRMPNATSLLDASGFGEKKKPTGPLSTRKSVPREMGPPSQVHCEGLRSPSASSSSTQGKQEMMKYHH